MSRAREGNSRSVVLTVCLVLLVIACGFGGMLLARHFVRAGTSALTYPVVTQAPEPSVSPSPSPTVGGAAVPPAPAAASAMQDQSSAPATTAADGAEATQPPPPGSPGAVTEDEEIGLALRRWQTALLSNDAAQASSSYSLKVKRYFLQQDVTRAYVQQYMSQEEARGSRLRSYDLRNLSIEHVGRHAVDVHFVASFTVDTPGGGTRSGSARTLLKMHQEDGDWKIYFERDYSG